MLGSLRTQISLVMSCVVIGLIVAITLVVQYQTETQLKQREDEYTQNLVRTVHNHLESKFRSIQFHEEKVLKERKEKLHGIVIAALTTIEAIHKHSTAGVHSTKEAQLLAMETLRSIRYDDGVGYLWISDLREPRPWVVMHPTMPECENRDLTEPRFYKAEGNRHIFKEFADICQKDGEGYVRYQWPKPTKTGLTPEKDKISFVKLYKPWGWVVGSGIYIDDLQKAREERIAAVLDELRESFSKLQVAGKGYMFLFDSNNNMLIHPILEGANLANILNPTTGNQLFADFRKTAKNNVPLDYVFEETDPLGKVRHFQKRGFVEFFEPLGWYICATVYQEDIEASASALRTRILGIGALFLVAAFILSLLISKGLTKPLQRLTDAAEAIETQGMQATLMPVDGTDETRELGKILNRMIESIRQSHYTAQKNEKNLAITVNAIGEAVLTTDSEGKITRMNEAACLLTNCKDTDCIGLPINEVFCLQDFNLQAWIQMLLQPEILSQERQERLSEATLVLPDNTIKIVTITGSSIVDQENIILGLVLVARDITDQKRMEEQILQSRKLETIGQLAGGVAHDFNNMLGAIIGTADLLAMRLDTQEDLRHYPQLILDAAERASDLTDNLLSFARKGKIQSTPIDLHESIKDTVHLLERSIDKTIQIDCMLDAEEFTVIGDPSQLQNALLNLGLNARDAMPHGGVLSFSSAVRDVDETFCMQCPFDIDPGHYLEITVRDTGVGMSDDIREKIFEPFFTTKEIGKGTGLGLAAVYGTMISHHGAILVSSVPQKGTTFQLYLPLAGKKAHPKPDTRFLHKPDTPGGTVLLVDDEYVVRQTSKSLLLELGYNVIMAKNGHEALDLYQEKQKEIRLVLLDLVMPGMSGTETFYALRKHDQNAKILIISGFSENDAVRMLMNDGAVGFIQKPFRMTKLSSILEQAMKTTRQT